MKTSSLLKEVQRLLNKDNRKDYEIAVAVDTSPSTIYNIRRGHNKNPSVTIVERVYKHLTGKDLEI